MTLRTVFELGRISNLPTVWSNVAAGWLLGGGTWRGEFAWIAIGGSLLYLAGMAMNDACDAAWDHRHKGDRPIVRGLVSQNTVWTLTAFYAVAGVTASIWGGGSNPIFVAALVIVFTSYNIFHKRWTGSTWFMGACRTSLYLIAASGAAEGGLPSPETWIWGGALGFYVVGLTYVARGESKGAPLVRWPLALLSAPFLVAIGFVTTGWPLTTLFFAAVFAGWVFHCLSTMKGRGQIGRAVGFFLAGMPLIDALAVSAGWPYLAITLVFAVPLLILFQRYISAT